MEIDSFLFVWFCFGLFVCLYVLFLFFCFIVRSHPYDTPEDDGGGYWSPTDLNRTQE